MSIPPPLFQLITEILIQMVILFQGHGVPEEHLIACVHPTQQGTLFIDATSIA
jgi:hypothetical protein